MALIIEFEQKELCQRFGTKDTAGNLVPLSMSTVRRMVNFSGIDPVRWNGNRPVFTLQQADAIAGKWQSRLKKSAEKCRRAAKRQHRNGHNGHKPAAKVFTMKEVKARAAR